MAYMERPGPKGTFFRLQVYESERISLVRVYGLMQDIGKFVISVGKKLKASKKETENRFIL